LVFSLVAVYANHLASRDHPVKCLFHLARIICAGYAQRMAQFTLICDGVSWEGWKSFSVRMSMEQAAHSFTFTTTDREQAGLKKWNVKGGSRIDFLIDDVKVVSGFVRKYNPSISAESHDISIEGESSAIDLVESSHLGPYFWKSVSAQSVIEAVLKPFGVTAKIDSGLTAIPKTGFRVGNNESPFEIVRKIAARDQKTVYTDSAGNLVVTNSAASVDAGEIGRGDYTSASASHDLTNAFSEIHIKSQTNDRDESSKENFTKKQRSKKVVKAKVPGGGSTVTNSAAARHRPLVYVDSGDAEKQSDRAEYIRSRFAGDVITASVTLKSHLNKKGDTWAINQKLTLNEPLLDANLELVVSELEFSLDESSGFNTTLSLKLPSVFNAKAPTARAARLSEDGAFLETMKGLADAG
jgi:prophage tail gpP-like protein